MEHQHSLAKTQSLQEEYWQAFLVSTDRASNKNGIVQRHNGVLKNVLERIPNHDKKSAPEVIFLRASLFTNMFRGSRILSSFQLVKRYKPSILGIPRMLVSDEIFQTHVSRTAAREIQKAVKLAMRVPYEDVRIRPSGELPNEILKESILEEK